MKQDDMFLDLRGVPSDPIADPYLLDGKPAFLSHMRAHMQLLKLRNVLRYATTRAVIGCGKGPSDTVTYTMIQRTSSCTDSGRIMDWTGIQLLRV
ncbi:hypothetical protein NM688_g2201 [Phlebia brevispora]|uniref:Uncharacterized protein n=1 Tax=Phlebia brevispora TaxID=194682 RepID=A0ACC1T969_9APHY|nr:hypothetical protein NM688_g2201 [Phlebia brevispora]